MGPEIKDLIFRRIAELSTPPIWIYYLRPLDKKEFPDTTFVEDLIRKTSPLFDKFDHSLRRMRIDKDDQLKKIREALFYVWQMRIGDKIISEEPITLGDVRALNEHELASIDSLDKKGLFGVMIISKLFK